MLENYTTTMGQSSNEELYRLGIERIHLVGSRCARRPFVANQHLFFQVLAPVSCDSIGVANSFEARFVVVIAQWLFT